MKSLQLIEQQRKHKSEIMAIATCETKSNFVVAGDRYGHISVWQRDWYEFFCVSLFESFLNTYRLVSAVEKYLCIYLYQVIACIAWICVLAQIAR